MIIQLYDVNENKYITEFEINGDVQDAIIVTDELTNYVQDSVEYERANQNITLDLDINVIQIQVKEVG